eukprot:TRINITY_DN4446_c0_g1_i1.p1 TRINITY_DN4446_c0_g1~~TRINITY_DN4446_c0_g1_i1.p1  ORF type:complete len:188 (+),score=31.97 TRINITY_DN4446_c0_g1_i1:43-606(+)
MAEDDAPPASADDKAWADYLEVLACDIALCSKRELPPQPVEIAPGVFLGGVREAEDVATLERVGINTVLNMAPNMCGQSRTRSFPPSFQTLDINADDDEEYDIFAEDVPRALDFIESGLAKGASILVHCFAGMNRSATVCAAWRLRAEKQGLSGVVRHLASRRGIVLQNSTFMMGLVRIARRESLLS